MFSILISNHVGWVLTQKVKAMNVGWTSVRQGCC